MTRPRVRPVLTGPEPLRAADIPELNRLFSDAFTERYRRDGLVGVRVPPLNPPVWRYAIDDAGDGAMCWRDQSGALAAFNVAHRSGAEGWMGPLAVRDDLQGSGVGQQVVRAGIAWLQRHGCRVIGLETMPRTMDNIGFYAGLGFVPGRLTCTLTLDAAPGAAPLERLGSLGPADQARALSECHELLQRVLPGYDFRREIAVTAELGIGDTLVVRDTDGTVCGWALYHAAPLVEGRSREELRVLKLVLRDESAVAPMARALVSEARHSGTLRAAVRVQGEYVALFKALVSMGARVRWTDLRMTLSGWGEVGPASGVVLSNWEI